MSRIFVVFAVLLLALTPTVWAHSTVESSIPADGSTVTEAKSVSLTFTKAVRLVTLKLESTDGEIVVPVDRSAPAGTTFSEPLPALRPGKYEVRWTASARDGHIMKGAFSFTLAAA